MPAIIPATIGSTFWVGLAKTAILVGAQYLIGRYERKKQERAARKRLQAIDVEYAGTLEPRRKLYGYFRAAGLNVIPAITTGEDGSQLLKLLALSDGELNQFDSITFNNDDIDTSDILAGNVNAGPYEDYAKVYFYNGAAGETYTDLVGVVPAWTSAHEGEGIAGVFVMFIANNEVYKQGAPNVVVSGEGVLVYDTRLDASPGADPDNPAFKTFSIVPSLQLADFLLWSSGGNELATNINWDDVDSLADLSEQSVTIPLGAGTTTQDRFTSSVEVYSPQNLSERDDTIRMLSQAFLGHCWWSGGTWRMKSRLFTAAAGTVTADDVIGDDVTFGTAPSLAKGGVFNAVRGSFVDQNQRTQPVTFPEVRSTTFETEDGERHYTTRDYKTVRTATEAQRNAIYELRAARTRQTINGTFRLRVWAEFDLLDVVTLTISQLGISGETWQFVGMKLLQNCTVQCELEKVDEDDSDDPATGDYTQPDSVGPPESTGFVPGTPTNFRATGLANGILFEWDPPSNAAAVLLYQLFQHTSSTPFSSATQVASDTPQTSIFLPKTDTTLRYYWIRAKIAETGAVGTQAPPSNGLPAAAASASGGLAAYVLPGSATVVGFASSLQTGTVAVTASGGTAPYTYATTFTTGGSGITINNGTTTTPYFSSTGLAQGETRSGTARIRVTDNVAATFDVYVAVTISRGYDAAVNDVTINSTGGGFTPAIAIFTMANDGMVATYPTGGGHRWLDPAGDPADFDVRYTLNSGALSSGSASMSTWINCSNVTQLIVQRNPDQGAGTSSANVGLEIRPAGGGANVDTATIVLNSTIP